MLSYSSLKNKPRIVQSLTGLKLAEFEQLLPTFEQAWLAYVEEHHIQGKSRKSGYGGGRGARLKENQDKLWFI